MVYKPRLMKLFKKLPLVMILTFSLYWAPDFGFSRMYSTWDTMEPDKCASAWLIKRFVDSEATFAFYPKGDFVMSGIPFDTPDAELRRYHMVSAFESILNKYEFNDPVLLEMGKIFHDIEINSWGKKARKESREIEIAIRKIAADYSDPGKVFEKSFDYFDNLYEELKRQSYEVQD